MKGTVVDRHHECDNTPVADNVVPLTAGPEKEDPQGMSFEDLDNLYSDVYGFRLCENCKIPTADFCCSEACYDAYFSQDFDEPPA